VLSTRKRKVEEGDEANQAVKVVLQAFDMLYLNGKSLLQQSLRDRRWVHAWILVCVCLSICLSVCLSVFYASVFVHTLIYLHTNTPTHSTRRTILRTAFNLEPGYFHFAVSVSDRQTYMSYVRIKRSFISYHHTNNDIFISLFPYFSISMIL